MKRLVFLSLFLATFASQILVCANSNICISNYSESKYVQEIPPLLNAENYISKNPQFELNSHQNSIHYCNTLEKLEYEFQKSKKNIAQSFDGESKIVRRPYDVIKYDLYMDWTNPMSSKLTNINSKNFTGTNTITIKIDSANIQNIEFDASDMEILSVKIDDVILPETPSLVGNSYFKIPLNKSVKVGDELKIEVSYMYIGTGLRGLYVYDTSNSSAKHRIVYTMSEPEDARYWMPCNDRPYDKALSKISVKVPSGFLVASNGLLVNQIEKDGTTTFVWDNNIVLSTYLMVATASQYDLWVDHYKRPNETDSLSLMYYSWPEDMDMDKAQYNTKKSYQPVPKMFEVMESAWGRYPFQKYGMAAIAPFQFGGMEHQTMTSVNRSWLNGFSSAGILHELAHQWLGDLVTCATWNDLWLNEGGATYSEGIWQEQIYGKENYNNKIYQDRVAYLNSGDNAYTNYSIYGFAPEVLFTVGNPYVYNKASFVYHMLRLNSGDSAFFSTMKKNFADHAYQAYESKDLMNSFIKYVPNPKLDFKTFFDQWVYGPGHPMFDIKTSQHSVSNDSIQLVIDIKQIQKTLYPDSKMPETFKTPVGFNLIKAGQIVKQIEFFMNYNQEQFSTILDFIPDSVAFNYTSTLAQIKSLTSLGIEDEISSVQSINLSPNIIENNNLNLSFTNSLNSKVLEITICDINGNEIKTIDLTNSFTSNGNISLDISNLSNAMYFVKLRTDSSISVARFIKQ